MTRQPTILCFATKGAGSNEEDRIRLLLEPLEPFVWPFDREHKVRSAVRLLAVLKRRRPIVAVLEGSGTAGGLPLMLARVLFGVPYVVSSGDAIAPFIAMQAPALWPLALAYEALLYRLSAGFIGWTPYLAGRALTFGAPRAMTAQGWSVHADRGDRRESLRAELGLAPGVVVFGLAGSLTWSSRRGYCYGLELVQAIRSTTRPDVAVVIVGDGDGRARLEQAAAGDPRVVFTGAVPYEMVPVYLSAFDVASLPQSVDGVGSFRYTTKLSEYVAAGLPVVTGQTPFAYDLDCGWLWRLPGNAPWDDRYVASLAVLMDEVDHTAIDVKAAAVERVGPMFDGARQRERVCSFIADLRG